MYNKVNALFLPSTFYQLYNLTGVLTNLNKKKQEEFRNNINNKTCVSNIDKRNLNLGNLALKP